MTLPELFELVSILDARSKQIDSQTKTIIVLLADLNRKIDDLDKHFNARLTTMARQNERIARAALDVETTDRAIAKPTSTKHYDR